MKKQTLASTFSTASADLKEKTTAVKEDFFVDCVIQAGELDESGYHFKQNDLYVLEVAKHNVPYSEFKRWIVSDEKFKRQRELEAKAKEHFGEEYQMKYEVCCFCTTPSKD